MTTSQTAPARPEAPLVGDERAQLTGFLDYLRATVVMKATGLTDEQARTPLVVSELTNIASLLAHLTYVEQYWFGVVLDHQPDSWQGRMDDDPDAEFRSGLELPVARLIADYEAQCRVSRDIVARLDLDAQGTTGRGKPVNVRWIVIHMIEETGRHAGHLDLLREHVDGRTGE